MLKAQERKGEAPEDANQPHGLVIQDVPDDAEEMAAPAAIGQPEGRVEHRSLLREGDKREKVRLLTRLQALRRQDQGDLTIHRQLVHNSHLAVLLRHRLKQRKWFRC